MWIALHFRSSYVHLFPLTSMNQRNSIPRVFEIFTNILGTSKTQCNAENSCINGMCKRAFGLVFKKGKNVRLNTSTLVKAANHKEERLMSVASRCKTCVFFQSWKIWKFVKQKKKENFSILSKKIFFLTLTNKGFFSLYTLNKKGQCYKTSC